MCHSIAKLPITKTDVCINKGRVGWKSQPLLSSIDEIFVCFSAERVEKLKPFLKIRRER